MSSSMRELDSLYQTDRTVWAEVARQVVIDHGMTRRGAAGRAPA